MSMRKGYKLVAWEGIGLFVPAHWEIGRHQGDERSGNFRIDDEARVVMQLRWWQAAKPVPFDRQAALHLATRRDKEPQHDWRLQPVSDLPLPTVGRAAAFSCRAAGAAESDILLLWQREDNGRVLMLRIIQENGSPGTAELRVMLGGLRLQGTGEPRDWALHDLAVTVPPEHLLRKDVITAGVIYLRWQRGRHSIGLRRFSAANAVLGKREPALDDVEAWCRRIYADAFYDLKYRVERTTCPRGRPLLRLTGQPRLLAPLEFKWLLPKHRRVPRRIDIIWDPDANKLYCVELLRPRPDLEPALKAFEESLQFTLADAAEAPRPAGRELSGRRAERQRSLMARVQHATGARFRRNEQGNILLTQAVQRPGWLRGLRTLAWLRPGSGQTTKEVELDLIGTLVWDNCDGRRVREIVELVRRTFRISNREAELSVAEFVRVLGSRGLLSVVLEKKA